MTRGFHWALNRMAMFTAVVAGCMVWFWRPFMDIAIANIWLNGVIIGTTLFGIGLCFVQMFRLLPEYAWLRRYLAGYRGGALPPRLLRPVALMLRARPLRISASALGSMLDAILLRFEDSRESVRYITNTLIFLGLLGTFWGLIITVGGFADLIGALDMSDMAAAAAMQSGMARPLSGMATAFTSSMMGLGGSLIVGFLALQLQMAQNQIFNQLEDYLAAHTHVAAPDDASK